MNGSLTEEAATPRLLASVHLSASPSSGGGGGTPGRTSQIAEEPEPGAAGGARRRGSPARGHEPPAPGPGVGAHARGQDGGVGGGGEEGEGEEEGWVPCGVPAESWRSARRQVRPPGERAPGLPPSLVGWARLQ